MVTIASEFISTAWIIGSGAGHSRFYDHFGTEPDTVVLLDGAVAKYPSGTTVHAVLTDLLSRIEALENGTHRVYSLSSDAWIAYHFTANAVIQKLGGESFKHPLPVQAEIGPPLRTFSLDAQLRLSPTLSFSAAAYKIDLVL